MHQGYSSKPQQEYIVKGAMATCMFGVAPSMLNTILDNMFVNVNGKLVATTMTLGPVFPTFGVCNMVPSMPKPCTCMIVKWDLADNFVTVNRIAHPLTKLSRGQCALGTPMCISFTTTGQFPIPDVPGIAAPTAPLMSDMAPMAFSEKIVPITPNLLYVITLDQNDKLITKVPEDGYVTLVAGTVGHNTGDAIIFKTEKHGNFTGYVERNNVAYARYCYFGRPDDIDDKDRNAPPKSNAANNKDDRKNDNTTESKSREELFEDNNVSPELLKDDAARKEALENLNIEKFQRSAWDHPDDGFAYDMEHGNVDLKGLSKEEFLRDYKRPSGGVASMTNDKDPDNPVPYHTIDGKLANTYGKPLSPKEHERMLRIRQEIYDKNRPDENTVFQKVVCCDKGFDYWINSVNKNADDKGVLTLKGSTLLAKDAKHLKDPMACYDGLQLNYDSPYNSYYEPQDMECVYVVRYTTTDPGNAKIPVHNINEVPKEINGDFVTADGNSYPFTGNGFTPATEEDENGNTKRLGTPELLAEPPQAISQAIVVRIDRDGKETIVGYSKVVGSNSDGEPLQHFVCVK